MAALSVCVATATAVRVAPVMHAVRASPPVMRVAPASMLSRGDEVLITSPVLVKGKSARGRRGRVADLLGERDADEWGCCQTLDVDASIVVELEPIGPLGYYAANELEAETGSNRLEHTEGDRVRVCKDVVVKGESSLGRTGCVVDVWTGCEVDPACCCNENASDHSITVRLDAAEGSPWETGYFSEGELELLPRREVGV